MKYYTQNFDNTSNGGTTLCYAAENAHNHTQANQFSKDVMDWLVAKASWRRSDIRPAKFRSNQGVPRTGKEFQWNMNTKKWEKV